MAVKAKEYLLSTDDLGRPDSVDGKEAVALLLIRLLLLMPGSDPLRPDMGVGLINYRYCQGKLDELKTRIANQISTYLPEFPTIEVKIVEVTSSKICNIEITIEDTIYIYDSSIMPVSLSLEDIATR